jgi:acetyl-CoA carboxylase carboxyltransferase component
MKLGKFAPYTDGVITGSGTINRQQVFVYARISPFSAVRSAPHTPRRSTR